MVSYCSLSNDRSLTKILIENSTDYSSKYFHRFVNTPEWVDGLDLWSSRETIRKNDVPKRSLDFHEDLGLYLPKFDQFNPSATALQNRFTSSKGINNNNNLPERLRLLIEREEDHTNISSVDQSLSLSNEQLSTSEDTQASNTIPKQCPNEISSAKVRVPLRQVESRNSSREKKLGHNNESNNREKFQYLLKEQLSNIFRRETTNIHSKRTVIQIPSVEIKHQNLPLRTMPQSDPALIMERYGKLQQLLISPLPNQPTINNKLFHTRQSPLMFEGLSTLGLSVTPLDFSSPKHFQTSSDQTSQQENSTSTIRPSTQPVHSSSSFEQNDEQENLRYKDHLQTGFLSPSTNYFLPTQHFHNEQTQTMKKSFRHHRSSSRTTLQRAKTFQFLPYIAGKRLDVNISNQRNS